MALVRARGPNHDYLLAERKLKERVIDILGDRDHETTFKPTLADQHKVGFFTLDRCSQTDVTEVVDLKEMTEIIQILLQDVANLRRDINLTKHVLQADYESKLQEKAVELYCRINEKMKELERVHEDRVTTVRRAFRQQLSDAIARVAVLYNKNLESKIKNEKSKRAGEKSKLDEQYKNLMAQIQRNENVISMLKMQLAHYQNQKTEEVEMTPEPSERPTPSTMSPKKKEPVKKLPPIAPSPPSPEKTSTPVAKSPEKTPIPAPLSPDVPQSPPPPSPKRLKVSEPPVSRVLTPQQSPIPMMHKSPRQSPVQPPPAAPVTVIEELSVKSKSPTINVELEEMKEEVDNLNKKIYNLETTIDTKEEKITDLVQEVANIKEQLIQEKAAAETYKNEIDDIRKSAQLEQDSSKKLSSDTDYGEENKSMEKQRVEMQRVMEEKMRLAREAALDEAQKEASKVQEMEKDKVSSLMSQKRELEELLRKERKKNMEKSREEVDTEKFKKSEQRLREEINRLKNEIDRINRTWEKKFAILQQSLHALKDESYLRQTLQRQAAALHHAAVSYAADTPMGIMAANKQQAASSVMKKPVIPDIAASSRNQGYEKPAQKGGNKSQNAEKDYISYTVSAPSGRGTAMMSVDEHQVMSDGDQVDIPQDIAPLPDPPANMNVEISPYETPRNAVPT